MSIKIGAKIRVIYDGSQKLEELMIETGEQTLFLDRETCARLEAVLALKGTTLSFSKLEEYYPEYILSFYGDERRNAYTEYNTPEVSLRPTGSLSQ
jgi:hypothetical protein